MSGNYKKYFLINQIMRRTALSERYNHMNNSRIETPDTEDPKKALTQQEVENFIMLAGQSKKRWFKITMIDEAMQKDPTASALMESISDVVHEGIMSMPFEESIAQAREETKGKSNGCR